MNNRRKIFIFKGIFYTKKTCFNLYNKAKGRKPDKPERDYLKLILLTKPPFDYQCNKVINFILDEQAKNIEKLSDYIDKNRKDKRLWQNRERNLKLIDSIKDRNKEFFRKFW